MDGNKDESIKCIRLSKSKLSDGDFNGAKKYAEKAYKLFPSEVAKKLIDEINDNITKENSSPNQNCNPTRHRARSKSNTRERTSSIHKEEEAVYTPEQLEAVKRIQKSKDFYEILGVEKDATDDDLKRSYKKLALKFHPDKNKAPGATEAFKMIGKSFAVLSDPKKRKQYDVTGNMDDSGSHLRSNGEGPYRNYYYDCSRGFDAECTAEELFNMFFGGGGQVFTPYNYHNQRTTRSQNQSDRDNSNYAWIQFLPLIFLLCMSIFSTLFVRDPIYQLHRSDKYSVERTTRNMNFQYYVKETFEKDLGRMSIHLLEKDIESDYLNDLRYRCVHEKQQKESLLFRARYYGDEESYQHYSELKLPHCQKLESIYNA